MVLGRLWSFSFWLPGRGLGEMVSWNRYKNYPKNGLIYPRLVFIAVELWSDPSLHSLNFNFNKLEPDTWQHYVISLNGFLQGKCLWMVRISLERWWVGTQKSLGSEIPVLTNTAHSGFSLTLHPLSTCRYNQNYCGLWLYVALKHIKPKMVSYMFMSI